MQIRSRDTRFKFFLFTLHGWERRFSEKKFSPDIFNHFPKSSGEVNDFLLVSEDFLKISADYLMVIGSVFPRSHLLIRLPRSLEYFGES